MQSESVQKLFTFFNHPNKTKYFLSFGAPQGLVFGTSQSKLEFNLNLYTSSD